MSCGFVSFIGNNKYQCPKFDPKNHINEKNILDNKHPIMIYNNSSNRTIYFLQIILLY